MKMHSHVKIDWDERVLNSEIEYSRALGGTPIVYPNFIHIYNNAVPWSGDFNRAVGVRLSSYESFDGTLFIDIAFRKQKERPASSEEGQDKTQVLLGSSYIIRTT